MRIPNTETTFPFRRCLLRSLRISTVVRSPPVKDMNSVRFRFLGLMLVSLLASCKTTAPQLPSQLAQIPQDLNNFLVEANGIYSDAWVGEAASCNLRQPTDAKSLTIRGTVPKIEGSDDFHTDLSVSIDGQEVAHQSLSPGDFELAAPVSKGEG